MPLRPTTGFYLGIFPLVLLLWVWIDSVESHSDWAIRRKPQQTFVLTIAESRAGWMLITRKPDNREPLPSLTPWYGRINRFGAMTTRADGTPVPVFPALLQDELRGYRPPTYDYHIVTIPLWLIVAVYLSLWLALSWWRARKRQKLRAEFFRAISYEG
jgi:hypothetical protein